MTSGRLLLLPCPIGESEIDAVLPPRVVAIARTTRYFLAERAKTTRAFLKALQHPLPLQEIEIVEIGHSPEPALVDGWLEPLTTGNDVALVSEAGCPAVADPGAGIVARAHERGLRVRPLVGPSSILLALMASGLDGQRFRFVGYLPQDRAQRTAAVRVLETASRAGETQVFIETPYRNERLLETLLDAGTGDTRLTIASALTGTDEIVSTRTIDAWRALAATLRPPLRNRPTVFALLAAPERLPRKR